MDCLLSKYKETLKLAGDALGMNLISENADGELII